MIGARQNATLPMPARAEAPPDLPSDAEGAADAVFLGIVRGLEAHQFAPGQRLVETELAARFGVGRNAVREAVQRLVGEGVVEVLRHRGAAIRRLGLAETHHVLDVAELMTGLLARTAAAALAAGGAGEALRQARRELRTADQARDAAAFGTARRQFYRALLVLAQSAELRRLFPAIQMPIVHAQYPLPDLQRVRLADYDAIGKAVAAGDPDAAEAAGRAHVDNVRRAIEAFVQAGPGAA